MKGIIYFLLGGVFALVCSFAVTLYEIDRMERGMHGLKKIRRGDG